MKTEIFESYIAFLRRNDKSVNGVTAEFAAANPGWEEERENEGCWRCSRCSRCSGCSDCYRCSDCSDCSRCSECSECSRCSGCSDCSRCSDCSDCSGCSGCSRCSCCSRCSGCSGCSGCSRCSGCSGCSGKDAAMKIPTIANIHQTVLAAASEDGALNMSDWHTCETTHCRAGWVVHLAGAPGKALEKKTSTLFAAMQIYKASSPIRVFPPRFFETNEQAMADMRRCAEAETNA